jgi:hypothetical protein
VNSGEKGPMSCKETVQPPGFEKMTGQPGRHCAATQIPSIWEGDKEPIRNVATGDSHHPDKLELLRQRWRAMLS